MAVINTAIRVECQVDGRLETQSQHQVAVPANIDKIKAKKKSNWKELIKSNP